MRRRTCGEVGGVVRARFHGLGQAVALAAGLVLTQINVAQAEERPVGSESVGMATAAETQGQNRGGRIAGPFELATEDQVIEPVRVGPSPDQSVYALPAPATEEEGSNSGGIHLDIKINYLTDHIYRGVDRSEALNPGNNQGKEDAANFQFDGTLSFDLGKMPHPFIGVFANVLDSDPVSNFQEVRPFFGAEWRIRPLILAAGNNLYQFPDRNELNTAEVWGRITLDDAAVFRLDEPLLSPYVYGAYDYDEYNGWYLEAGVQHEFVLEDWNVTLTLLANVAWVLNHEYFAGLEGEDSGLHHYGLGLIGRYSLNTLLNIPRRYGQWTLNGYVFYTDGLDNDLSAETDLWGGAGIQLTY